MNGRPAVDGAGGRVLLATRNPGKVRELRALLAGEGIEVLSAGDVPGAPDVPETGATFRENALLKAHALAAPGLLAVADDSGLEVDALGGAPGVRSARYAGEPKDDARNSRRLLDELEGVPDEGRAARFRCALALVADGQEAVFEGTCEGRIAREPRGVGGFGYDPVFLPDGGTRTMAELSDAEKNAISHRGRAFAAARETIVTWARRASEA
ncbi:XTP/dITP diphosphatase [Myxococcota bacterium]|nr:XTP/dITP diphosphatase [Myxococcota bacterium]